MKVKEIIKPTEFDRRAVEMKYPNVYKIKDYGRRKRVRPEKVTIRDTKTGQVYGRRTLFQKATS